MHRTPVVHHVLVVEDQADIRKLIRMTLDVDEYRIAEAPDGDAALAQVSAFPPDLMLLDVMMPGSMDGLAVCAALKADPLTSSIKVVMLSARGQRSDIEAGLAAGADAYLVKPFDPIELLELAARLLGRESALAG